MKNLKKLLTFSLIASIIIAAAPVKSKAATRLNIKKKTLTVGKSVKIKVKGTKKKAKWSSSNKKVATVNSKGNVKAKKVGKCTITAKIRSKKYKCKITVKEKNIQDSNFPSKNESTPTKVPEKTKMPTYTPTIDPEKTLKPTPTSIPSITSAPIPTKTPDAKPTTKPTISPTINPTIVPTVKPTSVPTIEPSANPTIEPTKNPIKTEYKIGETWEVKGQWKVTIDSVEETEYRNEFWDSNPEVVYMINYTYENIGYVDKDGIMDGLFIYLDFATFIDSEGYTGESYPGDITMQPKEIPVGAICKAQSCVGFSHKGDFKIYYDDYDGEGNSQKAIFSIEIK